MKLVITDGYSKGEIIKIIREWTELTQVEFAKRIGKSRRVLQNYEANEVNYEIETLLEIARIFDLEIVIEKRRNIRVSVRRAKIGAFFIY